MARRKDLPAVKRHIMIYDEDWALLNTLFGKQNGQAYRGPGSACCEIIHSRCKAFRAKMIEKLDQAGPVESARDDAIVAAIVARQGTAGGPAGGSK